MSALKAHCQFQRRCAQKFTNSLSTFVRVIAGQGPRECFDAGRGSKSEPADQRLISNGSVRRFFEPGLTALWWCQGPVLA
jgi:hypothetical protein